MEISSAATSNTTLTRNRPEPAANSALASDFDTFLQMLTTQMENQDPLNPIESSDFAVQLATFSGVEQQIRTNDLLADMVAGNGASGLAQLAGWIGMEARVSGAVQFDGAPITLSPDPDPASDAAYLIVRDERGAVASRERLPTTVETVLWGGVQADGSPLPSGLYSFELESVNSGEVTSTRAVDVYSAITEARLGASGVEIVLSGGRAVAASEVTALRSPVPGA